MSCKCASDAELAQDHAELALWACLASWKHIQVDILNNSRHLEKKADSKQVALIHKNNQNVKMNGVLFSLGIFASVVAAVFGVAVLMTVSSLALAAVLPRGHSMASQLRSFPGKLFRSAWHIACRLDEIIFMCLLIAGALLTIAFS